MKIVKTIFFAGAILLSVASCDNLEDLNQDKKAYTTVLPGALMTNAQVNYAFFLTNASVNSNNFRGYAQYWSTTTYTDEVNYNMERRNLGSSLSTLLYRDVLQDLVNAQKDIKSKEALGAVDTAIKKNKIAVLDVQIVMAYQALVDLFGNVPYSEALDINLYPYPKYDDAKTIYLDLAARLDAAIAAMDGSKESFGKADLIYKGDVAKWKVLTIQA
jgi:hypothetical protein